MTFPLCVNRSSATCLLYGISCCTSLLDNVPIPYVDNKFEIHSMYRVTIYWDSLHGTCDPLRSLQPPTIYRYHVPAVDGSDTTGEALKFVIESWIVGLAAVEAEEEAAVQ